MPHETESGFGTSATRLYENFGAHLTISADGVPGASFQVWAPNADAVSVIGDFNGWNHSSHPLSIDRQSGIWRGFIPGVNKGHLYKYRICRRDGDYIADKSDPFAFHTETPPGTASVVWDNLYRWHDRKWMAERGKMLSTDTPVAIYEVHLGSWRRNNGRCLGYREIALQLADYVLDMKFTHVELMPVMEHPFYGSWGYQVTGFFAPTARYGTPQDFMYLVDYLHQRGIGVIMDWVPSHFPDDAHGLTFFDGTHLYEHRDPRQRVHPEWHSLLFNYGRKEVRDFLCASALFWLEKYHIDGLRVDGVASMLYLDYGRKQGEWLANRLGGRENLEAVEFLRQMNTLISRDFEDVQTIAEESTSWPLVSRPVQQGGLGFGYKWDMGWMNDTLRYMALDPPFRSFQHHQLTFRGMYSGSESFILPLSHDEVVHGKASLLSKMPGDDWQKYAGLRLMLGYQYSLNAKKLLFMGGEFGQRGEWNHDAELEWRLLDFEPHRGIQKWTADLNHLYRSEPSLHQLDCHEDGFEWINPDDSSNCVLAFMRKAPGCAPVVVVCNFTPAVHHHYRVGVPEAGLYLELLNSDAEIYGGSGQGNLSCVGSQSEPRHGRPHSLDLTLPPLAVIFLKRRS
ncbi:1,4-alpha-glucan branching protein GlgB [Dehalogenimonas sp. 4OHTPN]|uniref:1,4-alpha-glucan branching enzyme GlgB n=1 Tax=Dehalogenimonas sp. 4OHTPN TaxID=3166643 RepID=A0AAU8G846_9CHLR